MNNKAEFHEAIAVYIEDQRVDEFQNGKDFYFNMKDKLNALRDAYALSMQEGIRQNAFLNQWSLAVGMVDDGIMDSVRFVIVPTDEADGVIIFKIGRM